MTEIDSETPTPTVAFKGFDQNMQCRGFQYADGQTYEHDGPVALCASGFHAVLAPLDVLAYYPPNSSEYRVVELQGVDPKRDGDSKVVARKLTLGAKIGIPGLVAAQIKYVTERATTEKGGHATGDSGAASATGYRGAASVKGKESVAIATGYAGKAAGALGCWIVIAERDDDYHILEVRAVHVDGEQVKAGTYYKLVSGELAEAGEVK